MVGVPERKTSRAEKVAVFKKVTKTFPELKRTAILYRDPRGLILGLVTGELI